MPDTNQRLLYPPKDSKDRISNYDFFDRIFKGEHFDAFNIKANSKDWSKEYSRLRYLVCNYGGLISKVVADMLFSEAPKITVEDGDQEWVDALIEENKLDVQNYESALSNSALGDAVYKIRSGKRNSTDEDLTVIIEDITPKIYFPIIDGDNVRQHPDTEELMWKITINEKDYLRKEIHKPKEILNELYYLEGENIKDVAPMSLLGENPPDPQTSTNVNFNLLFHTPNYKVGSAYFGISDYQDITTLLFGLNNRMTKVDNILDKHSDPILALPEGILDKDGKIKRGSLQMFEKPQGSDDKPEYIVWNASLEVAFKEIEKMVEFLFMFSEISPDVLGMGQGQVESGRALKLKLLRTIAKVRRKRLYYHHTLRELIYAAQVFAKENKLKVKGKLLAKDPVYPEIEWQDGLPVDEREQVEIEEMRVNAGLTTPAESIARIDGVDLETAEAKVKEMDEKNRLKFEGMQFGNVNGGDNGNGDDENVKPNVNTKKPNVPPKK